MKLHKLQAALKKAQVAEKSAKAAYEKIINRAGLISEAWIDVKAKYKLARKELKRMRKESALTQAAHKAAKRTYEQSAGLLEKLARKLKKAQKKTSAKQKTTRLSRSLPKTPKLKPAPVRKRVPANSKPAPKPTLALPISAETESFPQPAAAQA